LTAQQHKTLDEISSVWTVRRAQEAMAGKQPERSIALLLDAQRTSPQDHRITSALGSAYVRQHDYRKALDFYSTWGMVWAEAADYRAAGGAALAIDNQMLADAYLQEGLKHLPSTAGILRK